MSRIRNTAAIGAALVTLVAGLEGLRTAAYLDPVGIPTICFGSTRGVQLGDEKTIAECKRLLKHELIEHESGMRRCLREPDALPDGAYVAFTSFTFNVGVENFCRSSLARKANAGDVAGACDELMRWTRAKGIELPGLKRRRAAERKFCIEGIH